MRGGGPDGGMDELIESLFSEEMQHQYASDPKLLKPASRHDTHSSSNHVGSCSHGSSISSTHQYMSAKSERSFSSKHTSLSIEHSSEHKHHHRGSSSSASSSSSQSHSGNSRINHSSSLRNVSSRHGSSSSSRHSQSSRHGSRERHSMLSTQSGAALPTLPSSATDITTLTEATVLEPGSVGGGLLASGASLATAASSSSLRRRRMLRARSAAVHARPASATACWVSAQESAAQATRATAAPFRRSRVPSMTRAAGGMMAGKSQATTWAVASAQATSRALALVVLAMESSRQALRRPHRRSPHPTRASVRPTSFSSAAMICSTVSEGLQRSCRFDCEQRPLTRLQALVKHCLN